MSYQILEVLGLFVLFTALVYIVTPTKYRYILLLVASLIAMVSMSGWGVLFLFLTALSTYGAGLLLEGIAKKHPTKGLEKPERKRIKALVKRKKKWVVFAYCVLNLGILLVLKYFNFFVSSTAKLFGVEDTSSLLLKVIVPLGLSYYTLQAMSYVIDVFRGKYKAERNFLKLFLFVAFFPQLHEGPFGRYDALMPQLESGKPLTIHNVYNGAMRILWGLFKIFMVANRAAILSDAVFGEYQKYGGFTILFGGAMFTLQLYAEFSGYIDLARGVARVFGIDLAQNFDMPFLAQNVADFWRRWHISLGAFFREYVFYPVSTSRVLAKATEKMSFEAGNFVTVTLSLFVVWFLTGLWHGANEKYICYGLYYFVLIVLFNILSPYVEKALQKAKIAPENKVLVSLRVLKTWILVLLGMILFRAENVSAFFAMFKSIFSAGEAFSILSAIELSDLIVLLLSTLVMIVGAILKLCHVDLEAKYDALPSYQRYILCFAIFILVTVFGAYGLDYLPPDPIYGGF